jgi:dipeptidyl aminopeptidase/acylaminoacyl peptidase
MCEATPLPKLLWLPLFLLPSLLAAQVTKADYDRANALREKYQGLAVNAPDPANWIDGTSHFWYRKTVKGGHDFTIVEAETATKRPAFDHERLAAALSATLGEKYTAVTLPFSGSASAGDGGGRGTGAQSPLTFMDREQAITFAHGGFSWNCNLADYVCGKGAAITPGTGRGGQAPPAADIEDDQEDRASPAMLDSESVDGIESLSPQQGQGGGRGGVSAPLRDAGRPSPDGAYEAVIQNFNVFLKPKGKSEAIPLSFDGSEGDYYTLRSVAWSPDSKKLVAYKTRPGYQREVHYVQSSPADQLQPRHSTMIYAKPGDTLAIASPALFDITTKKETEIDNALFPNAYALTQPVWWKDGRGFTFEYNQRGHQVYRVIEVDAKTGQARAVITEQSNTFIDYRPLAQGRTDTGKKFRHDVADGKEIVWASERDGWEHLYLFDGATGRVEKQITKGEWVVKFVDRVDDEKRQIWFEASGMDAGKDPYFTQYFRINFDGTGLKRLTEADGDHVVRFSPDNRFYVDTWSRVDQPAVSELRSTAEKSRVMELEHGDSAPLTAAGWRAPESFTAKGRDGKTDIWGVIFYPANFDPAKKYPVVEQIYAGPQGSFVPKSFPAAVQPLTELGFVVAQIDGMGTNNRSKAFHDVAWKNLGDAGFADRILWHQAVAAKYPWYDISRVGVYGTSAGGQNAMGALLFHPEFYKVGVANSGCHDNRMDKIWWNEQWMGWPIGPEYGASSNVDNAGKLRGDLLLVLGEMDNNVDPSSTWQVVNQLIKHDKRFDLLFVPGGGHGAGGQYYQHLLEDFFVHHLMGVEPPEWNRAD